MKKSRLVALLIALMMLGSIIAACAEPEQEQEPLVVTDPVTVDDTTEPDDVYEEPEDEELPPVTGTTQDTVTVLGLSLPLNLVPWESSDAPSNSIKRLIFSRLFVNDYDTMRPDPNLGLAINWEQPDARTTHVEIRSGVYFHNGYRLTAYDVQFSLMNAAASPHSAAFLGMIESIAVHDYYNLTIYTDIDFAPIISHLTLLPASIASRQLYEAIGVDAYAAHPIGTGAWMFDNLVIGDRLELVRNPNYWGGPPLVERFILRVVPEASVRLMEVQSGTADAALSIAPIDIRMAEEDPNVTLHRRLGLSNFYIGINTQSPHLNNPLVRQALNYALDNITIIDVVFMGAGSPLDGPMPPLVWGYVTQAPFTHSMDRARELLIEAGYNPTPGEPGGFSTSIWWNVPNSQREQVAEMTQFTLAQLNIHVDIVAMEWAAYLPAVDRGEHDMFMISTGHQTGDPDFSLFRNFHTSSFGPTGNRAFFSDPEVDRLLEMGRSEVNEQRRLEIYAEAQQLIRDAAPWVFISHDETLIATVANLQGFAIDPGGMHNWTTVWFD